MYSRIIVETSPAQFHETVTSDTWSGYRYCAHFSKNKMICIIFEKEQKRVVSPSSLTADQIASFNEFWALYPKKKAKPEAKKAWKKIKNPKIVMNSLREHIRNDFYVKDKQFIPFPATFLNQERWSDEVDVKESSTYKKAMQDLIDRKRANLNREPTKEEILSLDRSFGIV